MRVSHPPVPASPRHASLASPLPWLCAHRGLSKACPENTIPAFAAAIAVGAHELELDLWWSRDGVAVVCHDETLERTTSGTGRIAELEWDTIRRADAGIKTSPLWRGTPVPRFEQVLDLVGHNVGLNIHIKIAGPGGALVRHVCDQIRSRGLRDTAYVACDSEPVLREAFEYAPDVRRACLVDQWNAPRLLAVGRQYHCQRVQFIWEVDDRYIRECHDSGMLANVFWANTAEDARSLVARGMDIILTDNAHQLITDGFAPRQGHPS